MRVVIMVLLLGLASGWDSYLVGSPSDAKVVGRGGFALMGGAADPLEEAFRWLVSRAPGGDMVVLSQFGDDYNAMLNRLGSLNSVQTIVVNTREAASDPEVIRRIDGAEIIFFGGGDQSRYINRWKGTPLEDALNRAARRGAAMGGTSAGLAILGEFSFSAMQDTVTAEQALADPFDSHVTLEHDFLQIPLLKGVITDSHFSQRGRMGRLLAFLARLEQSGWVHPARGIGVDETTALLVEPDGSCQRVGRGSVYFVQLAGAVCHPGQPLEGRYESVCLSQPEQRFDLTQWKGDGPSEELVVEHGRLEGKAHREGP